MGSGDGRAYPSSRRVRYPVYLNLLEIRLPPNALVSILHRVTGVLMILGLGLLVGLWQWSLTAEGFAALGAGLTSFWGRLAVFLVLWLLLHHLFAGLRYFALEFGLGESREASVLTAWAVIVAGAVAALAATAWLL
ncbi:MAG: succinate dehydrogenase, cytochrome b556 subunit [Thioalkalivibrionaceae bacterium]